MTRPIITALASASLIAAPVGAQTATVKNSGPLISGALGKPAPKTWADWWPQLRELVAKVKPPVGDTQEPELGAGFTKVPAAIPSNVNVAALLTRTGSAGGRIPPTAAPDNMGAFRFICQAGQISYDDPIVFPGQPGKSHLHQWFGNTAANASSTYASLRTTGDSTCTNALNRSAYWMPAMLDGKGNVVRPDFVSIYYKRYPAASRECSTIGTACVDLPRGLRFIFGYDMVTNTPKTGDAYFNCQGAAAKPGHYATISEAAANCPAGSQLGAIIVAPSCWDGKRLDSPNHRDHVGYARYRNYPDGTIKLACDDQHPYVIPQFTMGAWYAVDEDGAAGWYLSSDEMPGMERMPAGSTFHSDWFGAWDDQTFATAMANCINKLLDCSGGELGDGTQMKTGPGYTEKANPRLVPVPAREVR